MDAKYSDVLAAVNNEKDLFNRTCFIQQRSVRLNELLGLTYSDIDLNLNHFNLYKP